MWLASRGSHQQTRTFFSQNVRGKGTRAASCIVSHASNKLLSAVDNTHSNNRKTGATHPENESTYIQYRAHSQAPHSAYCLPLLKEAS